MQQTINWANVDPDLCHHMASLGHNVPKLCWGNGNQGKSEGFDSYDRPSNLHKFDPNNQFFSPCHLEIWCITSKNNRAPLLYYIKLCVSFQIHRWIQTEVTVRKHSIWVEISDFFVPCDLEIWWMTLENNRAPLLYYIKLCALNQIHRWIETEVTVRKRSIRVKIGDFLSCVTLKFDRWLWKTIDHTLVLLQALCIISQPSVNSNWSYSPETPNFGQNWRFFEPCDLEI